MPATMTATETEQVEFVSRNASLWISLEPAHDVYDGPQAARRTIKPARKVVFSKGRAYVDQETAAELRGHPRFGVTFWAAQDIMAPFVGDTDPRVLSGQAHSISHKAAAPPLANWDTMTANQLKDAVAAGKIGDLPAALVWEASHRNRGQVVLAISKAMGGDGDPVDDEPLAAEAPAADGFVQSVPHGAKGLG